MWMIIAISVLAYLVAGIATATMVIMIDGEPRAYERDWVFAAVFFWPIFAAMNIPIYIARWIKSRRAASREKPRVYAEEYDEP